MLTDSYATPNAIQSEPAKQVSNNEHPRASTSHGTGLRPPFWRRMSGSSSQFQHSTPPISRQSSVGARRSLVSRTDHDASPSAESNDFDNSKRSSWLKRISAISSVSASPASSIRPTTPSVSFSNNSATPFLGSGASSAPAPNKLVKRTSSQRALSTNHARAPSLRRPATSHQRSATFGQAMTAELSQHETYDRIPSLSEPHDSSTSPPVWRPYFTSGYGRSGASQPRKRHTSGSSRAESIRPVQKLSHVHPILVSAKSVESRTLEGDIDDVGVRVVSNSYMEDIDEKHDAQESKATTAPPTWKKKHRSRHSFSVSDMFGSSPPGASKMSATKPKSGGLQRQRNVTAPPRGNSDSPVYDQLTTSPLSPISNVSTFDIDLPRGTPTFPSYPNLDTRSESSVPRIPSSSNVIPSNRPKRVSLAPSDPASTTFGSDYDQRVFSSGDEDSVDFQSDTAYDSLATRATASSNSGLRGPCIETIFDESPPETSEELVALEDLMDGGTLDGLAISMQHNHKGPAARSIVQEQLSESSSPRQASSVTKEDGYEPDEEEMEDSTEELPHVSTPIKGHTFEEDDFMTTPMPKRREQCDVDFSSSPSSVLRNPEVQGMGDIRLSIEGMSIDDESEWDKATDPESTFDESVNLPDFPRHTLRRTTPMPSRIHQESVDGMDLDSMDWHAEQRLSIFDWSEQHRSDKDPLNSSGARPKTVHGKQTLENRGSRSSGRRGPSALHLRSQSVPVARESVMENDPHFPATKFGTWGLGNKGVSEEWNDDFEFDDHDNDVDNGFSGLPLNVIPPQGMKVPQSIIDRQASVHGQFSQVQEFMLLVEELKRLRVHGAALQLLEGPSNHHWQDAENIINLATLNDDDDDLRPPNSPASPGAFDDFDDHSPPLSRSRKQSNIHSDENGYPEPAPRRSMSSAATPPNGRPRGESLAQAKSFLQTIHQSRNGADASPAEVEIYQQKKLPFDTQDLRELVGRASTVTRALKEIVRKAEGVSISPGKTPKKSSDPAFSQIFHRTEESPSPACTKPVLPKSRSAHSYLGSSMNGGRSPQNDISRHLKMMTVV
jgi:hypothetical protein